MGAAVTKRASVSVTGAQVRMARAALGWSIKEAAERAGIGISSVQAIEAAEGAADAISGGLEHTLAYRTQARRDALDALLKAFAGAGIEFTSKAGAVGVFARHKGA